MEVEGEWGAEEWGVKEWGRGVKGGVMGRRVGEEVVDGS